MTRDLSLRRLVEEGKDQEDPGAEMAAADLVEKEATCATIAIRKDISPESALLRQEEETTEEEETVDASFVMKRDTRKSIVQTRINEKEAEDRGAQEESPEHHPEEEEAGEAHTQEVFHTIEKEKIDQDPPKDTIAILDHIEISPDPTARVIS